MPAVIIRKGSNVVRHTGVEGMHWYKRRFRNYDGTLTEEGKRRYYKNYYKKDRGGSHYGSMTDAGRKWADKEVKKASRSIDRENRKASRKKENKKLWDQNIKQGKDKPNTSTVEYIARNGKTIADEAIKTGKTIATGVENARKRRAFKNNAEGKSDQELRDRINRIKLEREYNSLTNDDTSRGYEVVSNVLNVAGSVASVALATVGIVAAVKRMGG